MGGCCYRLRRQLDVWTWWTACLAVAAVVSGSKAMIHKIVLIVSMVHEALVFHTTRTVDPAFARAYFALGCALLLSSLATGHARGDGSNRDEIAMSTTLFRQQSEGVLTRMSHAKGSQSEGDQEEREGSPLLRRLRRLLLFHRARTADLCYDVASAALLLTWASITLWHPLDVDSLQDPEEYRLSNRSLFRYVMRVPTFIWASITTGVYNSLVTVIHVPCPPVTRVRRQSVTSSTFQMRIRPFLISLTTSRFVEACATLVMLAEVAIVGALLANGLESASLYSHSLACMRLEAAEMSRGACAILDYDQAERFGTLPDAYWPQCTTALTPYFTSPAWLNNSLPWDLDMDCYRYTELLRPDGTDDADLREAEAAFRSTHLYPQQTLTSFVSELYAAFARQQIDAYQLVLNAWLTETAKPYLPPLLACVMLMIAHELLLPQFVGGALEWLSTLNLLGAVAAATCIIIALNEFGFGGVETEVQPELSLPYSQRTSSHNLNVYINAVVSASMLHICVLVIHFCGKKGRSWRNISQAGLCSRPVRAPREQPLDMGSRVSICSHSLSEASPYTPCLRQPRAAPDALANRPACEKRVKLSLQKSMSDLPAIAAEDSAPASSKSPKETKLSRARIRLRAVLVLRASAYRGSMPSSVTAGCASRAESVSRVGGESRAAGSLTSCCSEEILQPPPAPTAVGDARNGGADEEAASLEASSVDLMSESVREWRRQDDVERTRRVTLCGTPPVSHSTGAAPATLTSHTATAAMAPTPTTPTPMMPAPAHLASRGSSCCVDVRGGEGNGCGGAAAASAEREGDPNSHSRETPSRLRLLRQPTSSVHAGFEHRPLRILCIDGGGVKGLNPTLMLGAIEQMCGKPICQLFDLIAGTSIGASLAMCVSCGVSIDRGLDILKEMATTRVMCKSSSLRLLTTGAKISSADLDPMVRDTVRACGVSAGEAPPLPTDDDAARATARSHRVPHFFMTTATADKTGTWKAFINSNYSRAPRIGALPFQLDGADDWSLFARMRAAVAAPTFFPPYVRPSDKAVFVDAAIVANNPTLLAIKEAQSIWPGRPIGCIVSLGCGKVTDVSARTPRSGLTYWAGTMLSMPMEVYRTHKEMQASLPFVNKGHIPPPAYFRLEPPTGEYDLDESRPKVLDKMCSRTMEYVEHKGSKMDRLCATLLLLSEDKPVGAAETMHGLPTKRTSETDLHMLLATLRGHEQTEVESKTRTFGPRRRHSQHNRASRVLSVKSRASSSFASTYQR